MRDINVRRGGDSFEMIEDRCKQIALATGELGITNPLSYYHRLIDTLSTIRNVKFVSVESLGKVNQSQSKTIALRHDVDADIAAAAACANHLSRNSIPGTFYILHTAHYYGAFSESGNDLHFTRHDGFKPFLEDLISTQCEIGIHNDALGVVFDHNGNGMDAFVAELNWLRTQGAEISGSAGHNSPAVYGAECFEIFSGMAAGNRKELNWRGRKTPLQTVSMQENGLLYEANHPRPRPMLDEIAIENLAKGTGDLLRQPAWQEQYFLYHPIFERGYEYDAWLIGRDTWVLAGNAEIRYPLTLSKLVDCVESLPLSSRIVISVHPIYVSE